VCASSSAASGCAGWPAAAQGLLRRLLPEGVAGADPGLASAAAAAAVTLQEM
jgi:hypothetical protein